MAENGLRFQIRYGDTVPKNGELKAFELGYLNGSGGALYMGTSVNGVPGCRRLIPPGLGDHDAYLPLTGGTLTNKLTIETTVGDTKAYCKVKDKDTAAYIQMGIHSNKEKIGICTNGYYDASKNFISTSINWMMYRDTDGNNIFNGNADSATKDGAGNTISSYYLPLKGGTLTGNLNIIPTSITDPAYVTIKRKIDTTYYRGRMYVSSAGFTILNNSISTNNNDWTDRGYFAVGEKNGEFYASVDGDKVLTAANYDKYALPLTGGTLTGNLSIKKTVNNSELTFSLSPGTFASGGNTYSSIYISNNPDSLLASGIIINELGLWYRLEKTVDSSSDYTYYKCLHGGNYSDYALPIKGGTLTGTLEINANGEVDIADYTPTLSVGSRTGAHIELDENEIQAMTTDTQAADLYLNTSGGSIYIGNGHNQSIRLRDRIVLSNNIGYGSDLPSSGITGQIFFKLEE